MTTLTLKSAKTSKSSIRVFKSHDELKKFMLNLTYDKEKKVYYHLVKKERFDITGVAYDHNEDTIPLLQKYGIIPSDDEY